MSDLNVFGYGKCSWRSMSGIIQNIRQFFRNCKYAWQRATRGYCDWDAWDLDCYYGKLMCESLTYLRDHTHSYPGKEPWDTPEKWFEYLTEIITHLEHYLDEESNEFYQEGDKYYNLIATAATDEDKQNYTKQWVALVEKSYFYCISERQKALLMLATCWDSLWD